MWKADDGARTATRLERIASLYDADATTPKEVDAIVEQYRDG